MASACRDNSTAADVMTVQLPPAGMPFHSGCPPACHVSVYDDDKGSEYSPCQHKKEMPKSEDLDDDEKWIQRSILA